MAANMVPHQAEGFIHGELHPHPAIIQDGGIGDVNELMDLESCFRYSQPTGKDLGSPLGDWAVPGFSDSHVFGALSALNGEYDFSNTDNLLDPVLQDLTTTTTAQWPLTAASSNPDQSNSTTPSVRDVDSEEEISFPIAHYIRKLADLNVSLHEHAATIPPQSAASPSQLAQFLAESRSTKRKTPSKLPTQEETERGQMFAIDQTFKLTQTLIDVLVRLHPHFDSRVVQHEADLLPFLSLGTIDQSTTLAPQLPLNSPDTYARTGDSIINKASQSQIRSSGNSPLDQGTVLLILSCYHRLIDIYEAIFIHMEACIKHSITPLTMDGRTFRLPPLKVGDYVAPASAAIAMQMMLVIRMSSQLFNQMQEVIGVGALVSTDNARDDDGYADADVWHVRANLVDEDDAITVGRNLEVLI
ncbi:hypothetical protein MMC30_006243 [Trapelia coarctata]|nr:hypothetical protein [Trapelia coarctata]